MSVIITTFCGRVLSGELVLGGCDEPQQLVDVGVLGDGHRHCGAAAGVTPWM